MCTPRGSLRPHKSTTKQHLDRFSCFCRAHGRDQHTDHASYRNLLVSSINAAMWAINNKVSFGDTICSHWLENIEKNSQSPSECFWSGTGNDFTTVSRPLLIVVSACYQRAKLPVQGFLLMCYRTKCTIFVQLAWNRQTDRWIAASLNALLLQGGTQPSSHTTQRGGDLGL